VGHFAEPLDGPPASASIARLGCIGSGGWVNMQGVQWFFSEVWPKIRGRLPDAELWLAGGVSEECESAPGVRILGKIPRLEDFYRDCAVVINPARSGTGLKIKTIEAMAHGRPVVTTSVGAMGLDAFRGRGMVVCDTAEEFAKEATGLLADLPQARLLGEAALRQAQQYCAENRRVFAEVLRI